MTDKILTLLGFASKSRQIAYGFASTAEAIKSGKAKGVFYAFDISPKSQKEVLYHCKKGNVPAYKLSDINTESLSHAIGRNCGVVAVLDSNFISPLTTNLTSEI